MTCAALAWSTNEGVFGGVSAGQKRKLSRRKIRFIDLIRPEAIGESFCYVDVQLAFAVVQWMLRTGESYRRDGEWGRMGVTELLCRQPTCCGFSELHPFTDRWRLELFDVFHYALLSAFAPPAALQWRREQSVTLAGERIITFPHYDLYGGYGNFMSNAEAGELIDSIFALAGRQFNFSPNECHPKATWIHEVWLHVRPENYQIKLSYAYKRDCSRWYRSLPSDPDEPLIDFIQRAKATFEGELLEVTTK
ncbi:MAG TPA: hypothetical protein VK797_23490 [Tepidisphaeraceae bacterium]|jgi:hypothetical protein|nr:hypothetical protein [Tepidisphaeraceae bacterium]